MKSVTLENTQDGHAKEYRLSLEDVGGGVHEVVALWGKIGSNLTRTVKFSGNQAKAEKQFKSILQAQLNKGYVEVGAKNDGQGAATAGTQGLVAKQVIARIVPMLCGPLMDISELESYMSNDIYVLEEKHNGIRKEITKVGKALFITNKQGQPTAKGMLPATQAEFLRLDFDFTVDTEDEPVGGGCVLLDVLTLRGKPLDRRPRSERRPLLEAFYAEAKFTPKVIRLAEEAVGTEAKRTFFERIKNEGGEGVIVKDNESIYIGGEKGREHAWKYKFQSTASFIVDSVMKNGKRSIGLALLDGTNRVNCGNCSIPINKDVPALGKIIECRFLYAERGSNKLHQPFFLGERDDVAPNECRLSQLKYKQRHEVRGDVEDTVATAA